MSIATPQRAQGYEKELAGLAASISEAIEKAGKTSVAVVDFSDLQGSVTELGRFMAEELSVRLITSGKGISIVDRASLRFIVAEQKLTIAGLVNPENAKKLGQMAGVDALVMGTITPLGDSIRVTLKVVATDTVRVVAAAAGSIAKTPAITELLSRGIETPGAGARPAQVTLPAPSAARTKVSPASFQNKFFRATITSIGRFKRQVTLALLLENISERTVYSRILYESGDVKVQLIDNTGTACVVRYTSHISGISVDNSHGKRWSAIGSGSRGIAFEIFGFETCAKKTLRIRKLHVGINADSIRARDAIEKPICDSPGLRYPEYLFPPFEWYGSRGTAARCIAPRNQTALRLLGAKGVGGVGGRWRFR
jgi:TolB-like protein